MCAVEVSILFFFLNVHIFSFACCICIDVDEVHHINHNFQHKFHEMVQSRSVIAINIDGTSYNNMYRYIWHSTDDYDDSTNQHPYSSDHNQLYNVSQDPSEVLSYFNDASYFQILHKLQLLLIDHINSTCVAPNGCRMPTLVSNDSYNVNEILTVNPTSIPTDFPTAEYCCHAASNPTRFESRCNALYSQELCQTGSAATRCVWTDDAAICNLPESCGGTDYCTSSRARRRVQCESHQTYFDCVFSNCDWECL